jgi:hypothetical protein
MFQLVKSEVKELTPKLALEFRDMEASPTERDLNGGRVKHLREKAEAGLLVTFHWSVANFNGKRLRMNGQHSSNMLCELNGKFPKGLKAHIDEYEVPGAEDLALLFRQFDDKKSGRSTGDVAGAYQGLYPELRDVPKASAKLAIDGVSWYRRTIDGTHPKSGDGAYEMFAEKGLHPFVLWIGDVFSIKTPELKRAQVISAMYATFIANEKVARTFWDKVARGGDEYNDTAPETVLDNWLKAAADKEKKETLSLKPANFYQGCIFAWNAHREEKSVKDIKSDTKKGFHKPIE